LEKSAQAPKEEAPKSDVVAVIPLVKLETPSLPSLKISITNTENAENDTNSSSSDDQVSVQKKNQSLINSTSLWLNCHYGKYFYSL
jgi:hypothetical protein